MARAEQVLTLPMAVYVDDNCLMGPCRERVDAEMQSFQAWALDVVGLAFKVAKDRVAAQQQLALGFVWDSTTLTRTIEERKLAGYLDLLLEYLSTLGLAQMQAMAGKLHRMILTLPPGARCLAVSLFELMSGLRLPWHRRRTTRRLRADFMLVHALLSANLGRGHYSYAHFRPAPPVWTDASKQARYTGGGWVSACGAYDYFKYGSRAARQPIDFLEGDTVVACVERLARLCGDVLHRQRGVHAVGRQGAVAGEPAERPAARALRAHDQVRLRDHVDVDRDRRQRERGPPVARTRRRVLPDRVRDGRVDGGDGARADAGRGPDAHLARGAGGLARSLAEEGLAAAAAAAADGRNYESNSITRRRGSNPTPTRRGYL